MTQGVVENAATHRFELPIAGDDLAVVYYQIDDDGHLVLVHTEVPPRYWGEGYASKLAAGALALIRASGRKIVVRCPFISAFLGRHPEFGDILA